MKYPFEVEFSEIQAAPEPFVAAIFSSLASEFMTLPKGEGFVDYEAFEIGYEALKKATNGFAALPRSEVLKAVLEVPIAFVVLRSMLGFTPPEWAYVAAQRSGSELNQGFARTVDRKVRVSPLSPLRLSPEMTKRIEAMVGTACDLLEAGCPGVHAYQIHRLQKADTVGGLIALRNMAAIGAPYAMLLYERFLGRPFAGHRDSVSELVGDGLENAIEEQLANAGISFRKTKRAERFVDFDQAPDFMVPSEYNPKVVIEAKLTEDDGTARDKVTRIQHLHSLSMSGQPAGHLKFEVIACIAGRGFGVRREDMRKLLLATRGKIFTPKTLDRLVDCTALKNFKTK
jgi:anti-sigma factor RsiW